MRERCSCVRERCFADHFPLSYTLKGIYVQILCNHFPRGHMIPLKRTKNSSLIRYVIVTLRLSRMRIRCEIQLSLARSHTTYATTSHNPSCTPLIHNVIMRYWDMKFNSHFPYHILHILLILNTVIVFRKSEISSSPCKVLYYSIETACHMISDPH